MRPILLTSLALVLTVTGGASAPSLPAPALAAATQGAGSAAGLVIADPHGGPPKTVCVRFAEGAITGRQLLDRATQQRPEIDPVYARFGSRGHAVCALCGEGCDAGDCFCQSRYWNYNVARDGGWTRSGVGVDQRTVEHGDVDGWAFGGDGAAPPYLSFEQICGPAAQPSPSATAQSSPTATPTPTPATATPAPTATATASPSPLATSPTTTPTPTVSPVRPSPSADPEVPDPEFAARADDGDDGGRELGGAVAFLAIIAGLVGLILLRRR